MLTATSFKFIVIFNAVEILFATRPEFITHKDAIDLLKSYRNVMNLRLKKGHPCYNYSYLSLRETTENKGFDLFFWHYNKEEYFTAYNTVYEVLESVCYTFMYRFCVYAIEMNRRGENLRRSLENFKQLMGIMYDIFIEAGFVLDSVQSLWEIYYNDDDDEQLGNGYEDFDQEYFDKLSEFMGKVEHRINFAKIRTYDQQFGLQILRLEDLKSHHQNELRYGIDLLRKVSVETENQDERSCMSCPKNLTWIDSIIGFVPCGHLIDCCFQCSYDKFSTCPICDKIHFRNREVKAVKPSTLFGYDFWDRIPKNAINEEARCIVCKRNKPPKVKMIAIPCGHGLYCQKCMKRTNCLVCEKDIRSYMILQC